MSLKYTRTTRKIIKKTNWFIDKGIWWLAIFATLFMIFYLAVFILPTPIGRNTFNPGPISIGSAYVKLNCISNDPDFIVEKVPIVCYVSLLSRNVDFQKSVINIEAVNLESPSKAEWSCSTLIYDINNESYTTEICKNPGYEDTFTPRNPSTYHFRVSRLDAHQYLNETGRGIGYEGTNEVFDTKMTVLSRNDAQDSKLSQKGFIFTGMAILINLIGAIIHIRNFSVGK